jgi:hypothetical protein
MGQGESTCTALTPMATSRLLSGTVSRAKVRFRLLFL